MLPADAPSAQPLSFVLIIATPSTPIQVRFGRVAVNKRSFVRTPGLVDGHFLARFTSRDIELALMQFLWSPSTLELPFSFYFTFRSRCTAILSERFMDLANRIMARIR